MGTGRDLRIRELAELIKKLWVLKSEIKWDSSKADGTPRRLLDVSRIKALEWKAKLSLEEGIKKTYEWHEKSESRYIRE